MYTSRPCTKRKRKNKGQQLEIWWQFFMWVFKIDIQKKVPKLELTIPARSKSKQSCYKHRREPKSTYNKGWKSICREGQLNIQRSPVKVFSDIKQLQFATPKLEIGGLMQRKIRICFGRGNSQPIIKVWGYRELVRKTRICLGIETPLSHARISVDKLTSRNPWQIDIYWSVNAVQSKYLTIQQKEPTSSFIFCKNYEI